MTTMPYLLKYMTPVLIFCGLHTGLYARDIFSAARVGDTAAVSACLRAGTPVDTTDERGSTPLIVAAYNNRPETVALLLACKAGPDVADRMGNTALMGACFRGYPQIVRLLLDAGADPDRTNPNGATALTFAATFGHTETVALLLHRGADKTLRDRFGKTPADHARLQENEDIFNLLK